MIAARRPDVELTLLDANERRVAFLREAVRELRAGDRSRGPGKDVETSGPAVTVLLGRAEDLAHRSELREAFDVVVARSFGAPAVTAECAVGFLLPAGRALVSEPPSTDEGRWPAVGLARLDLEPGARHPLPAATVQELLRVGGSIEGLPRSVGIPARRPFF